MATSKKISTEANYKSVMGKIDRLMSKGSGNLSKTQLAEIRKMALEAQEYEQKKYLIAAPTTLAGCNCGCNRGCNRGCSRDCSHSRVGVVMLFQLKYTGIC